MQLKINAITKIIKGNKNTYYFIQKKKKIILPVEYTQTPHSNAEDTYIRTLKALKVKIISINIYLFLDEKYYVYLNLSSNGKKYEINTNITNAMNLMDYEPEIQVYIKKDILIQNGIKVTKELIEKSLMYDF